MRWIWYRDRWGLLIVGVYLILIAVLFLFSLMDMALLFLHEPLNQFLRTIGLPPQIRYGIYSFFEGQTATVVRDWWVIIPLLLPLAGLVFWLAGLVFEGWTLVTALIRGKRKPPSANNDHSDED